MRKKNEREKAVFAGLCICNLILEGKKRGKYYLQRFLLPVPGICHTITCLPNPYQYYNLGSNTMVLVWKFGAAYIAFSSLQLKWTRRPFLKNVFFKKKLTIS
ncbi:hypothetical protein ACJX0J_008230, partial [Zea mays]